MAIVVNVQGQAEVKLNRPASPHDSHQTQNGDDTAMLRRMMILALLAVCSTTSLATVARAEEPALAHMVFFTLKDRTPASRDALLAGCKKHLTGHDGTVYFSVGTRGEEFKRDVNDLDYDVALHMVFKNKEAHDKYQVAPRHEKFIEENKALWGKVRVFDSYLSPVESK